MYYEMKKSLFHACVKKKEYIGGEWNSLAEQSHFKVTFIIKAKTKKKKKKVTRSKQSVGV